MKVISVERPDEQDQPVHATEVIYMSVCGCPKGVQFHQQNCRGRSKGKAPMSKEVEALQAQLAEAEDILLCIADSKLYR